METSGMWQLLLAFVVVASGCTIGDPSSTAPETAGAGQSAGGRGGGGRPASAGAGQSAGEDGGQAGGRGGSDPKEGGDAGATDGVAGSSGGYGAATAGSSGNGGGAGVQTPDGGEAGAGGSTDGGSAGDAGEPLPNYAGVWSGTNSQGGEIRFVYDGAGLVELAYDWLLPICGSTTIVTIPSRPAIVDGQLSYYAGGNPTAQFEIDFDSTTQAHGTYTFTLIYSGPPVSVPVCRGTETVTFTASNTGPP
jgi:hypothetical protein